MLMDLEFMLLDTFDGLRPKNFPKVDPLEQSNIAVRRIRQAEAYMFGLSADESSASSSAAAETV